MIYEKYPELKYKYRNREFWCRGYYVDTTGKNAKKIEEYKKHQLDEDKAGEQMTIISWKYISTEKNLLRAYDNVILKVASGSGSTELTFELADKKVTYSGEYKGTVTFKVSVE